FSGFWSKDAILAEAWHYERYGLFAIGLVAAFFTAFYMSRLFFLVFMGKSRNNANAHESPAVMTIPLVILAVLAIGAGFIQTPFTGWFGEWLTGSEAEHHEGGTLVMILSTLVGLLGIGLGYLMYMKNTISREIISGPAPWLLQ